MVTNSAYWSFCSDHFDFGGPEKFENLKSRNSVLQIDRYDINDRTAQFLAHLITETRQKIFLKIFWSKIGLTYGKF